MAHLAILQPRFPPPAILRANGRLDRPPGALSGRMMMRFADWPATRRQQWPSYEYERHSRAWPSRAARPAEMTYATAARVGFFGDAETPGSMRARRNGHARLCSTQLQPFQKPHRVIQIRRLQQRSAARNVPARDARSLTTQRAVYECRRKRQKRVRQRDPPITRTAALKGASLLYFAQAMPALLAYRFAIRPILRTRRCAMLTSPPGKAR